MKTKLIIGSLLILVFAACTKDEPIATPAKTIDQLLTEKAWKVDEIRIQLSNNTTAYYKRGGTGNTTNYDSDSLKFLTSNTGTYYFSGTQTPMTWNWTNTEKSKMTITINYTTTPVVLNLENINISQTNFRYAQYSSGGGISYLASGSRTQN